MTYNPLLGRWMEEDPLGFDAGDVNLYRYVGNDPTTYVDPTGTSEKLPAVDVTPPGKTKVGTFQVEFGSFKEGVGVKGSFTSQAGAPATLKAAAQGYGKSGDHFNLYQVVVSDTNPPFCMRDKKPVRLKPPYVDPPPDAYVDGKGIGFGPAFDLLPWYYNDGGFPGRLASITSHSKGAEFTFIDVPADPNAKTTLTFKTWLVVLDGKGKFVAWAGVGFTWKWSNATGRPVVSDVKMITGAPEAKLLPGTLYPP